MAEVGGTATAAGRGAWDRFARALDAVGAIVLLALAIMTLIDVVGRELHGINRAGFFQRLLGSEPLFTPLRGADELTVMLMATSTYAVFAGITWRQEHVAVDLVDLVFPRRWIALREILINLVAAAFLCLVTWALFQRGELRAEDGEVFEYTRMPRAPFLYFFAAMGGLTAVVLLCNAYRYAVGRGPLQRPAGRPEPRPAD